MIKRSIRSPREAGKSSAGITLLVLGLLLALMGGVFYFLGSSKAGQVAEIKGAPAMTVDELAKQTASLDVVKVTAPIGAKGIATLPGKRESVVYGELHISAEQEVEESNGEFETRRENILTEKVRGSNVVLGDALGTHVAIDADAFEKADLFSPEIKDRATVEHKKALGGLITTRSVAKYGDVSGTIPEFDNRTGTSARIEVSKRLVTPGQMVFCVAGMSIKDGKPVLGARKSGVMMIDTRAEADLVASLEKAAGWMKPAGYGGLGVGVLMLLIGAGLSLGGKKE
ncbi:MAG: hypothetical protein ACYTFT_03210 [Planctomycetota bacterium]|jgi:hypothetical protein